MLHLSLNATLKPKHNLLIHYPNIIRQSGPSRYYWCFRFEEKYKKLKSYARSMTLRKNITSTIAKKFQLKFVFLLIQLIKHNLVVNPKHNIKISLCYDIVCNKYKITSNRYECYTKVEYLGTN